MLLLGSNHFVISLIIFTFESTGILLWKELGGNVTLTKLGMVKYIS